MSNQRVKKIGGLWAIDECSKRTGVPRAIVTAWLRGEYNKVDRDDMSTTLERHLDALEAYDANAEPEPDKEYPTKQQRLAEYGKRWGKRAWS